MDNVMHIIKVAVPILFALIVLILLWTLFMHHSCHCCTLLPLQHLG